MEVTSESAKDWLRMGSKPPVLPRGVRAPSHAAVRIITATSVPAATFCATDSPLRYPDSHSYRLRSCMIPPPCPPTITRAHPCAAGGSFVCTPKRQTTRFDHETSTCTWDRACRPAIGSPSSRQRLIFMPSVRTPIPSAAAVRRR